MGAAVMLPGSTAFDITSDKGLEYFNQSGSNSSFSVDKAGTLNANQVGAPNSPIIDMYSETLNAQNSVYMGQVSSTPADNEYSTGQVAFYAKSDGNLYKRPYGGSESKIGNGTKQWQEDGNGNITPIDSETVGDGTTTANHQSVSSTDVNISNGTTSQAYYADWGTKDGGARDPQGPIGHRPMYTDGEMDIYVDPDNGDDTNDGTSSNPVETLLEAMRRVPFRIIHSVTIHLADGTYTTPFTSQTPILANAAYTDIPFKITGNTSTPSNVHLDHGGGHLGILGGELADHIVEGIRFEGDVQIKTGGIWFRDCEFGGAHASKGVSVYDGTAVFERCTFEGDNGSNPLDYAVISTGNGHCIFFSGNSSNGFLNKYAFKIDYGGKVTVDSPSHQIFGKLGELDKENGTFVKDGEAWSNPDQEYADDFNDNRIYNNRIGSGERFRPEWFSSNKDLTSNGSSAQLASGGGTAYLNNPKWTFGEFEIDFQFQSDPTTGSFRIPFLRNSSSDQWYIFIGDSGGVELVKYQNGSNTGDVITGSWPDDTNEHTIKVIHSTDIDGNGNEGFELFIDGSSQGTATDSFTPEPDQILLINETDANVDINELVYTY